MRNIKIIVEYDGTSYHGWQRQKGLTTIQQLLEESIGRITTEKITVIGAGRTDAGVHALNQTAHFKTGSCLGEKSLLMGINSLLPCDVVVKDLKEADETFHARFDVKSKVYMYQIFNDHIRPALYRNYAWHIRAPLDLNNMKEGLGILKGVHEFSSFCGKKEYDTDCVRTITVARIEKTRNGLIRIFLEADGFLRYMVRAIVGTIVEVGKGKRKPGELTDIIAARERKSAGATAPPHGLFLFKVKY